jgi:predicted MFS family arabinose efflux permease
MPDLSTFTALRVTQGVLMSAAFSLTMAYLAEERRAGGAAAALAAYVTGNVASNFFGRLTAAAAADHLGLPLTFGVFAGLNLLGALVVYLRLEGMAVRAARPSAAMTLAAWRTHFANGQLVATFAIGFLILFAFLGTFTYVNFVLAGDPIALSPMGLGFVYFVFLPSILTTPLAAPAVRRFGVRPTFIGAFAVALSGAPLLVVPDLAPVLAGLALMAVGTFFAQATATGHVSRIASGDRAAASGMYLASYYLGGLVGSAALGLVYGVAGWTPTVAGIALSLAVAAALSLIAGRRQG